MTYLNVYMLVKLNSIVLMPKAYLLNYLLCHLSLKQLPY